VHNVRVRELAPNELNEALGVVVRAMRDNALHVRAFGDNAVHREQAVGRLQWALVESVLARGTVLCAEKDGAVIGVLGMAGRKLTGVETIRLSQRILTGFSPSVVLRLFRWFAQWTRRVPKEPYWHLGPVAVDVHHQSKGVGSAMMAEFRRRMDQLGALAYLETDRAINVEFYRKFGFKIVDEATVIGVRNWFMTREP
jgi:ribosomal protein S18 acetylase RimI-like enzyme